ncbi:MAG: hypothetical protein ACXWIW_02265 [Croceibacterium sp.]
MTIALLIAAAAAAAQPSPQALDYARRVAPSGVLVEIARLQTRSEVEGMIKDHPELTEVERNRLRALGQEKAQALVDAAIDSEARAMAAELSLDDLRALAAFATSPAAEHQRAALPKVMASTVGSLGKVDYAGGVRAAFCTETGKLCDKK